MATFQAFSMIGVDSDWLFPGVHGGDFEIVTHTTTTFSIKYADGPAAGKVVSFISTGGNFQYGVDNLPTGGTFDTIELWTGGQIPIKLAI
ncbi:MAG: hypothetical protein FJX44_09940 [Alphaproteobacteria bacterium]|nr:hypothetical protein [Alphaproteobacteria bacterium]